MQLFASNIEILRRASPAKASKRFVCCAIDMMIVFFVALLIFSGLYSITKRTSSYLEAKQIITEEIEFYQNFTEESHLVQYIDGSRCDSDIIVFENINRAIYHSYITFGNVQQPDFIIENDHPVANYGEASLESDNVAYFYVNYVP